MTSHTLHPDWIVPDWPAPPGVRALCSTRQGGHSRAPWDSLNLGTRVQDDPEAVARNRARFSASLNPARPVYLAQVHGAAVVRLDPAAPDDQVADAAMTDATALACLVQVADCLPVLLCDARGERVAAAHAGWRGLAGGVIEATVAALRQDQPDAGLMAWLGPCIGPDAFEVGGEVREAFVAGAAEAEGAFRALAGGKWLANLPALARQRLTALGVASIHGNDGTPAWCTVTQSARFFSHRRDSVRLGASGRMAACVWREA